ncbi:helix-turn-helix domain-containing protein [Mucilaginibacter glaciei]|uniref:MarR family transcriptional regulator n=1 Tax=Mucilaginibacter glaciei TaxID=2772109 RepID=A0A926S3B9_9SPHI|nr:hypothetical protein [Mucilaginibacter glaciei]MBD1395048.1 hypothetical protein [Mucilaginibacter glaciei]
MIAKDLRRLSKLYVKVLALQLPPPHTEYMAEAMLFISGSAGCVKQKQLVDFMEVDRRSLMPMLKQLLDMGYLLAEEDPACNNEHLFSLAENGKKVMPQIYEAVSAAEKIMEEKLGEPGLSAFKKGMVQIEVSLKSKVLGYEFKKP